MAETYSPPGAVWCPFPTESRLRAQLGDAYYCESCSAPLRRTDLRMHEIYLAILNHLPWWARVAIMVRNWIVAPLGLHAEPAARVWRSETGDAYAPGDRIIRFIVYSIDQTEIIAGRDDRHLNFRVSVLRMGDPGAEKVVVSTLIFKVSTFGRAYLLPVLPLHRIGIRRLLTAASASGRI